MLCRSTGDAMTKEAFTYQISDLDQIVTDAGYAYANPDDVEELAAEIEDMLLSEHPSLNHMGLVLVIGDSTGTPLHIRPLGVVH
jgi:hypothetical protein